MPSTSKSRLLVAGVDGCKGGWLCFTVDLRCRHTSVRVFRKFADVLAQSPRPSIIAVDIPIGLTEKEPRKCDLEARSLLGKPRGSSVFPAPVRVVLVANSYAHARSLSFAAHGKKISKQTFAIVPKIREVDTCMNPVHQKWVREIHPEVCFYALNNNHPMKYRKRSPDGHRERLNLLAPIFPALAGHLEELNPTRAASDDLLDAAAAAWTAERILSGTAKSLSSREPDSKGLIMEIMN